MEYKKLLIIPLAASLVLTACGKDDENKNEPGKISEQKDRGSGKENTKDSSKENGDSKTEKESNDNSKKSNEQETIKNEESSNEILSKGKKSKKYGKNDESAKNDKDKLTKELKFDDNKTFLENANYVDNNGEKDISTAIEENVFDNPDQIASDSTHDSAYKELNKIWKETKKVSKSNTDAGASGSSKQADSINNLIKNHYYGESQLVSKLVMYGNNDWEIDQSSLKLTDYGAENVWMYKYDLVDKEGTKMASVGGKYYDVIHQQTIIDLALSNKGAEQLYDKVKYAQNDKKRQ